MAQTGFTPIQLYSSSTSAAVPIAGNLAAGELAINTVDGKLFYKDNAGAVQTIAYKNVPLSTVTGTLAIANGGTGTTSTTFVNLATNVTGTLPIANGGSGATTAATARTSFGATTLGGNLFTISNPSAVTFPRFNADNTVSSLSAADFRTAIGAGVGGGTVTSVSGTGSTSGLTLSGTVTSTGNITLGGAVSSVTTASFSILEEGGKLVIKNGSTVIASFSAAGALIAKSDITGFGTP
jgi:hypothetical protein